MKKGLSLILMLVLVTALVCTPAFAERTGSDDPTSSTDVKVDVTMDINIDHKYCVDIDYPASMTFTYTSNREWDPENYEYVNAKDGSNGWSDPQSIKITNHSDLGIKYDVSQVVSNTQYGDLSIDITGGTGTINGCSVGTADGSMNATFSIGVSGVPDDALKGQEVTLGKITIKIEKAA